MELSRRGMLAGLGVAGGLGVVGFVGAAAVTDDADDADGEAGGATPVDPDAPFEAVLVASDERDRGDANEDGNDEDDPFLFDAADLDHVQTPDDGDGADDRDGSDEADDEHLVYVALSPDGHGAFRERLEATAAADDPASFAVSMTLDGEEVRRVDLDGQTVAALTDEEWNGLLELAFESATVAADVYESLAAE